MLDSHVLLLNRLYQAVNVVSVRKAFSLLFTGKARAVESDYSTYDFDSWRAVALDLERDEYLATPAFRIKTPRVVLLREYDKIPDTQVKFTRKNVFLRDRCVCQYCARKLDIRHLTIDVGLSPSQSDDPDSWSHV